MKFTLIPTHTLFFLLVGSLANPVPSSTLVSCLADSGLNVETSQSSSWQNSTTPYNTRFQYNPTAIVYPTQASDVSRAVQCAGQHGVRVSALSGGHSYSASGYGSQDGALVIMFRDMAQVTYNPADETAIVQPGAHLGDFALKLYEDKRAAAHGQCPQVGFGGHAGFGGWGLASRNWGLLIDQVVAAEAVLANGTIVNASKSENQHLFWGIRGASSSFGIVTRYTVKTHAAPNSVIRFAFNFYNCPSERFAQVLQAYQMWGMDAPKEMGIITNIWQGGKDIEMAGYYMGSQSDFNRISASLLNATGQPDTRYVQERDWKTALTEASGESTLSTQGVPDIHDVFYAKSLVVPKDSPITTDAFAALGNKCASTPPAGISQCFVQAELWGGGDSAVSSVDKGATAYPHREHHITLQFYCRATSSWTPQGTAFVNGLVDSITDNMPETLFGGYANYLDPELQGWRAKYYAANYAKLAKLQKELDPLGRFMKSQNIGAPDY